ncbi:adenylate isopentenyltransferase 5, chloroplastic [Ziziphus jujuba]|uniref:adenylate dimethylallyltransferase (ADP/ATP-dependent) n=2 Tax=Ziziphus jujuba TaxID=326968 RepID=A0A6P4A3P6_ZIZJJ|nr:adenylate isopentenyltransferase 5, chloroplastic [Ziziphus jujuba]KAH7522391.1 hypothetical protein FEM48_Zijuj07G0133300 [Ziziphus jujuba var. spinosa]
MRITYKPLTMKITPMSSCKPVRPLVSFEPGGLHRGINMEHFFRRKDKVVFVIGATGTGKSRLAIDLASRFPAEVVNSDKMQVYRGLEIATNKVTEEECRGIPHHLLGIVDPNSNFTSEDFCHQASVAIDSIVRRDRLPIIAGGSNSFIYALNDYAEFRMKYEPRFLWVDVSLEILHSFVSERVDKMVEAGLLDEVKRMFDPEADYSVGIRRAIGVPEMDEFLRAEAMGASERTKAKLLRSAIAKIKENTCLLARRQLQKIHRLNSRWDWNMHRLDASEAFLKRGNDRQADEAWDNLVAGPATMIVDSFLYNDGLATINVPSETTTTTATVLAAAAASAQVPMAAAVAAASR